VEKITESKTIEHHLKFSQELLLSWIKIYKLGIQGLVGKTEIVTFHKTVTSGIKLNKVEIHTKLQMSVLRVVFDSKLYRSLQVENSVRKARNGLQGLRLLSKYFTISERLTLIMSFFYSCLYCGSLV